jgi:hypothetical protein
MTSLAQGHYSPLYIPSSNGPHIDLEVTEETLTERTDGIIAATE